MHSRSVFYVSLGTITFIMYVCMCLSDMALQQMQLQQAEFGTGQTEHEVHLQLTKK